MLRKLVLVSVSAVLAAVPAGAAVTLGGGDYVARNEFGSPIAQGSESTNLPDTLREVSYLPVVGVADYAFARGMAGDRYARAGSAAGVSTPNQFHQATGIGRWIQTAVANGTGTVDITALFRGNASFSDALSLADRNNFTCGGPVDCSNYADTGFDFTLYSRATFGLTVEDMSTNDKWFLLADFSVAREIVRIDEGGGVFSRGATDRSNAAWSSLFTPSGGNTQFTGSGFVNAPIVQVGPVSRIAPTLNLAMAVPFVAGRSYTFDLMVQCITETAGLAPLMTSGQPGLASCDATNSGYLTGFTNFRDGTGGPIAPFAVTAADGTNLALPSPLAPGGGPAPIPEPASWAMLIAGFGLVGAVARRRRMLAI